MLPPPFVSKSYSNREMLELAAKAAGYVINVARQDARDSIVERKTYKDKKDTRATSLWIIGISPWWNPLLDDRQAFRLAVDLGLHVSVFKTFTIVYHDTDIGTVVENHYDDRYAATRLAITRAAALIGRRITENDENANVSTSNIEQPIKEYTVICNKSNNETPMAEFSLPQHATENSKTQPDLPKIPINTEVRPVAWLFTYKCPGKLVEFVDLEPELHPIKRDDLMEQGCIILSVTPLYTATQLVSLK